MGGTFPQSNYTSCDVKNVWGQHGLNLGQNDKDDAQWYGFLPSLTSYEVPETIFSAIGGG